MVFIRWLWVIGRFRMVSRRRVCGIFRFVVHGVLRIRVVSWCRMIGDRSGMVAFSRAIDVVVVVVYIGSAEVDGHV